MRILIDSDAHRTETLANTRWGIATARRAWLTTADVANTRPWSEFAPLRKRAGGAAAQPSKAGSKSRSTTRSTAAARKGAKRSSARVAVARRPGRRAPCATPSAGRRRRAADRAARERQRDVRPAAAGRDELAAVGQRLELGEAVVLVERRGDEHARAAQQRAVLGGGSRPANRTPGGAAPAGRSRPQITSSSPSRRAPAHAVEDAVEALLARVGGVGDRGDVTLVGGPGIARLDRHRHDDRRRAAAADRAARSPRSERAASRQRSRRPFERPLPDPVAPRPVGHRERVEADRPRPRPQQRGGGRRVDDRRAVRGARSRRPPRARAARAHSRSVSASVRTWRWRAAATTSTVAPARAQRVGELSVERPQPGRRAERHDQHVDHRRVPYEAPPPLIDGTSRRIPGVRLSTIGRIGDVSST